MSMCVKVCAVGAGGEGILLLSLLLLLLLFRGHSGSVVECLTRDRGAAGSSLTGVTVWGP